MARGRKLSFQSRRQPRPPPCVHTAQHREGKREAPTHSDTSGRKGIGAPASPKWVPKVCLLSQLGFQFLFPQRKWIDIERKRLQSS